MSYLREIGRGHRERQGFRQKFQYKIRHRLAVRKRRSKMEYGFTTDNFETEVLQSSLPVFVDFYADWCNPCKVMAPVVEKLAEEFDGRVKVGKCNIDENMQIAQRYRVANIPTFMMFKEGKPCATQMGVQPASELKNMIGQALD
ncbi:MAG: thioredoxin [Lachnospiraceae bacterium]|nr:thioredoxin [Butyrivibrio sp.]MCM1343565.1 thioredoxin [Muribaculaceae bacterium]MCM1411266.1 thioredoxin [Lachnospiraceae bacterium]